MKNSISQMMCMCKKPLITVGDAKNGKFATVTVLGVGFLIALVMLHICAFKIHEMTVRKKIEKCKCR